MEPRNYLADAEATPPAAPAAPSYGYPRNEDLAAGKEATEPGPYWFYKVGESLRRLIAAAGFVPDDADLNMVLNAVQEFDIGINQTLQDVVVSRTAGITYYNVGNKPITVYMISNVSTDIELVIDGLAVSKYQPNSNIFSVAGIVPPGSSYVLNITGGSVTSWVELK